MDIITNKAASYFNISEYQKAKHILHELYKISPDEKKYAQFFIKCMRTINPGRYQYFKTISLAILLSVGLILIVEILIIRCFFADFAVYFEIIKNSLVFVAIAIFICNEFSFIHECKRELEDIQ